VPECLEGDALRLRQVLLNLVSNAIKFTEKGEVRLRVEKVRHQAEMTWIQFRLSDTGIGMSPEQMAQLFKPFTQAETSTYRKYGGTGLGLSITQMLIRLMKGHIRVHSEQGVGSVFWVTIPFKEAESAKTDPFQQIFEKEEVEARPERILVVED